MDNTIVPTCCFWECLVILFSVVWIVNQYDCFVRSKCYTFLESLLIEEQNKHGIRLFSDSGIFYRPEWKSAQNHKNLNISWTTNAIIVLRKTNILQEISRPKMLHTLIYGPEWKLLFWSVKLSEIIFCKIQPWQKFEVNRMGGSNVIGWSVYYTWNLSKRFLKIRKSWKS